MSRLENIYKLHQIFKHKRHPVAKSQLAEVLQLDEQTIKRCINTMRDRLDAPLEYNREANGWCYRPETQYELPGMWFNAHELSALLLIYQLLDEINTHARNFSPWRVKTEQAK